jgi:hypothetical protein
MYAKSYDVPYLDLLPVLRDYVRETKKELYVRGDPHFNNEGHSILGQVIADWFLSVRGKRDLSQILSDDTARSAGLGIVRPRSRAS